MTIPPPAAATSSAPTKRSRTKTMLSWVLTAALLGTAWGVNELALPEGSAEASFITRTQVGAAATTRNLAVTVTDVRAAHEIVTPAGRALAGTWLIVDVEAQALDTSVGSLLGLALLTLDERSFSATDRTTSFYREQLQTRVPRSGSLAFELPSGALQGEAMLQLGLAADARLDGVIEIRLPIDEIPVEDQVQLRETGWAER